MLIQLKAKTTGNIAKECTKCREVKPLDQFHNKSSSRDGKNSRCAVCISEDRKSNKSKNDKTPVLTIERVVEQNLFDPEVINEILSKEGPSTLKTAFLSLLKYVIGSKTGYNIKEELVANVLNLDHCKDVNGPDAYDKNTNAPWEIKTNFVAMDGNNKITAGGSFNDITEEKLKEIPKYTMAVGVFVDSYLLAIGTFPGSWEPFINRLYSEYHKKKKSGGRVCSSFHYNDWKDCPDLEWAVLPDIDSLYKYKDKMTAGLYSDLKEAMTNAIESNKGSLTSRNKKVNIQY